MNYGFQMACVLDFLPFNICLTYTSLSYSYLSMLLHTHTHYYYCCNFSLNKALLKMHAEYWWSNAIPCIDLTYLLNISQQQQQRVDYIQIVCVCSENCLHATRLVTDSYMKKKTKTPSRYTDKNLRVCVMFGSNSDINHLFLPSFWSVILFEFGRIGT